jgi:hypothetical protein
MPTTTNYGWTTPADTDLVKDGASAIRTLGTAIDTTVFNNASAGIAKTIVDAKGDIIAATAADTVSRLAVGANNTVLTADSSTATGLKWAAVAAGSNYTLLNSGGTALTAATTITVSGISGADKIFVLVTGASMNAFGQMGLRLNTDTGSNYTAAGLQVVKSNAGVVNKVDQTTTQFIFGYFDNPADSGALGALITGANSSGIKIADIKGAGGNGADDKYYSTLGYYNSASTISSISIFSNNGNFDAGTVYVYTSA